MTKNLEFNQQDAFIQLKERAKAQGINNKEAWDSLVESFVNAKIDVGELDPDQALEQIEDHLQARFSEYESSIDVMQEF